MTIHVSAKHKVIGVPVRPDIANLFPSAKQVTLEGKPMLVVRHGVDETTLLRNMGIDVPTPVLSHYDWEGGTPFESQRKTAAMLTMNSRCTMGGD